MKRTVRESEHDGAPTSNVARFEYKYRLDLRTYLSVANALRALTRHDRYSLAGHDRRYFVRSLYFDTFDYQAYTEKVAGVCQRAKYRIRTYGPEAEQTSFVKMEIKAKHGNLTSKHDESVPLRESEHFLQTRRWSEPHGPVCLDFQRQVLLKNLTPKVLVDYEREALVPRDGGTERITFDHEVRFATAGELFPRRTFFVKARPQTIVMEVKVRDTSPPWLEDIVRRYELTSLPNSKYQWAVEQTQHAVVDHMR